MPEPVSLTALRASLPPVWPDDPLPACRRASARSTLVVLDDDPTGTQTVRDVPVLTAWDRVSLAVELAAAPPALFLLTNSRALSAADSRRLHRELAEDLRDAATAAGRPCAVVSRSDSTLRGHFPLETDVLAEGLGPFTALLLAPYFEAGGRYTVGGVHYVAEGDRLVPAGETAFARDPTFGYRHSRMADWVEEKTGGRVPADRVAELRLEVLRGEGPEGVARWLRALPPGTVAVADACDRRDSAVLASGTLAAEARGARFLYRTAAEFVAARLGQSPAALLAASDLTGTSTWGGLTVVGSHVPKSTAQLARLREVADLASVEIGVPELLDENRRAGAIARARDALGEALAAGRDAVLHTSRALVTAPDPAASLVLAGRVSAGLVEIVQGLPQAPRYLIAKGGITSSDLATRALGVRRAMVLGQALPGVPVWRLGPEARFPDLPYIVFPGNVGPESALADLVRRLRPGTPSADPGEAAPRQPA